MNNEEECRERPTGLIEDAGRRGEPKALRSSLHPFEPDWCIAPAATLREWLDENRLSPRAAVAGSVPRDRRDKAAAMIEQVLAAQPLTEDHAGLLEKATGIPARFWLNYEHNYRAGLAAGLTDVTGVGEVQER